MQSTYASRQDSGSMKISSGHWYVVLSSRELKKRPVGKTRFGTPLVFWRDAHGEVVCLEDRCPHRGAALSQGCIKDGILACPYHGIRFTGDGRCVEVPVEDSWHIPEHFRARSLQVRESQEYVWLWRGPAMATDELPPPPVQPVATDATCFEECIQHWPTHYTRCVEGVIDHSHIGFVHKRTLGLVMRDPITRVEVNPIEGGFRSNLMKDGKIRHYIDLTYPNVWTQNLSDAYGMSTAFAPVDDKRTEVYCRLYHNKNRRGYRPLMALWNRFTQFMVFHEDMAILATQSPANVDDAQDDKLLPSDAAHVFYRKLRKQLQDELAVASGGGEPQQLSRKSGAV